MKKAESVMTTERERQVNERRRVVKAKR